MNNINITLAQVENWVERGLNKEPYDQFSEAIIYLLLTGDVTISAHNPDLEK